MKDKLIELGFTFDDNDELGLGNVTLDDSNLNCDFYTDNKNCFLFMDVSVKYTDTFEIPKEDEIESFDIYKKIQNFGIQYNGKTIEVNLLDDLKNLIKKNKFKIGKHKNKHIKLCLLKK